MESNSTSSGIQGGPGWAEMENISQDNIQILSEETLRAIAKGPLARFVASCEDDEKVNRVWQSLLNTYSARTISSSHTTASNNAVSVFVQSAMTSQNARTKQIAQSPQTWMIIFEDYMNRFDDSKSKSMRDVLFALIRIMKFQEENTQFLKSQVVDSTIPHLILPGSRSRLKASILAIEVFIRKSAIPPTELISLIAEWLVKHHTSWTSHLQKDCEALSIDVAQFINQPADDTTGSTWRMEVASKIFVLGLTSCGRNMDSASAVGHTLAALFDNKRSSPCQKVVASSWVAPVRHVTLQNMDALETISNQILHRLFQIDPDGFNRFINTLPFKSIVDGDMTNAPLDEITLLLSALQIGKKVGLVHEDYQSAKSKAKADGSLVMKSDVIGQFLLHHDSSIRITALSLLVYAPSTTKPFTSAGVWAILKGLPYMHAESDAYSRSEILSLTSKLITRIKGGVVTDESILAKNGDVENGQPQSFAVSDQETQAVVDAYMEFLTGDLRPGTTYARHITALKCLVLVLASGLDLRVDDSVLKKLPGQNNRWTCTREVFKPSLLRLLVDLLLDPFEDVRSTSLYILKLFPREILLSGLLQIPNQSLEVPQLVDALSRAEEVASNTSRADHADTVARLYDVLFNAAALDPSNGSETHWWETKLQVVDCLLKKLEKKLSTPGGLFKSSMRDAPLHGFLSAVRYIVTTPKFYLLISDPSCSSYDSWRSVHDRTVLVCERIWEEVKPVLCVDSPEGHTDEPVEDLNVGPKDILSYSWRALRESSLLLHATLANTTYGPPGDDGMKRADYEKIGSMSFIHLAELRHRGAFTTVSQTFTTCCERCGQSKDPSISSLPEIWYQEVRKLIFEAASKLTRRSAGLPALATGILSSRLGGPLFHRGIKDLHEIASMPEKHDETNQDLDLPQVHAMNCLKDVYSNNRLAPHAEIYIMHDFTLSAERLGSPVWAIRNSGLMLFRALMPRMSRVSPGMRLGFGGDSGAEPGARISFGKYPGLVELLSKLLSPPENSEAEDSSGGTSTERVFPALELIGEKVPSSGRVDNSLLRRLVLLHLQSPVLGVREHAARVWASLLTCPDILKDIQELLGFYRDSKSQNYVHGKALAIKFALRRFAFASDVDWKGCIDDVLTTLRNIFATVFPSAHSPLVATVLIEILNEAVEKSIELGIEGKLADLVDETFNAYDLDDILDYLFDLSDPSWKFSSTARATPLLRRVFAWAMSLKVVLSGRFDDLECLFQRVSDFDTDAARWVLEQTQKLAERERYRPSLLSFYSSVVLGRHSQNVKSMAIEDLTSNLEALLEVPEDIKKIDLPFEALEKQLVADANAHMRNRDMANAELRLQGCLLALRVLSMESQITPAFEKEIRKWEVKLQFAMSEETEFTTRYAAASSLAAFGYVLRPLGSTTRVDAVFLNIYLALYDMLNDDDEEIRDLTSSTASWVLSYSSLSPGKSVSLSPLDASALLATFIAQSYSTSLSLCNTAIQYMVGQKARISSPMRRRKLIPVSDIISELRKESTVLFVEEKQNLFIDDIRDLDIWAKTILHLEESAYNYSLLTDTCEWVSDGLAYLSGLAADKSGVDGLLGWTAKPEIYTLGMRIITIASTFISKEFSASRLLGQQQNALMEGLKALLHNGQSASLHPGWLSRIETVLEL